MRYGVDTHARWRRAARGAGWYAKGGELPFRPSADPDAIPAILSPGRSTRIRPGESLVEAMERLLYGEDL